MKKILIFILLVIIAIFAYNKYEDYQRFHSPNADYKASEKIDVNYYNQNEVYNYQEAITQLNAFVTTQWSANRIDVKSPEDDDKETKLAVDTYAKKLAKVKYYESKIEQSKVLKEKGWTNTEIKNFESLGVSIETHNANQKAKQFKAVLLASIPSNGLRAGQKNAFVYEIQKLLIKKGHDIPTDGVFKTATSNALMEFEAKNNLFVDGNIDVMTLEALLK